ncbi:MAG: hypothetical protein KF799_01690 [Bdellovibrionales bacterium]|nr:hypothetical protein [Bdellovibrionales bacterium]
MSSWVHAQGRMLKSARAIKAYFEHKLRMPFELLTEAPQTSMNGDIAFSADMHPHGLWGIRPSVPLAGEQELEVFNMFHTILNGVDKVEQKREDLHRLHGKLAQMHEELPSNVIPLRRTRMFERPTPSNDQRWVLKLDCLIESKHVSEIHKMAMELHAHSRRYAFVDFRDLDGTKRTNLPELLSLGAISLFVPELMTLSMTEQDVLKNLMKTGTVQRPLLMVGTGLPFSELRTLPGVHIEFLTLLSRAYIKLSKPFSEYKDQGLIHYFLDCLSQNPT